MKVMLSNNEEKLDEEGVKSGPLSFVCFTIMDLQGAPQQLFISLCAGLASIVRVWELQCD